MDAKSELFQRAINSNNLALRADINDKYSTNDFNKWVDNILENISFEKILDVCCGTGNQLIKYIQNLDVTDIVGVDISSESLKASEKRLKEFNSNRNIHLINSMMENMFNNSILNNMKFDLISCFYGLYYSKNVDNTINNMLSHLNENGKILIVGPYGNNNKNLFNILEKYFKLPEAVLRSSNTFMEEEVYPILKNIGTVRKEIFYNEIHYPNIELIMNYWKASTFYSIENEENVFQDLKSHFDLKNDFVVEKYVIAYIVTKN